VGVGVHDAGNEPAPFGVDDAGARVPQTQNLAVRSNRVDTAVLDSQCGRLDVPRVVGEYPCIDDDHVRAGLVCRRLSCDVTREQRYQKRYERLSNHVILAAWDNRNSDAGPSKSVHNASEFARPTVRVAR
jgi:hypothetical protein